MRLRVIFNIREAWANDQVRLLDIDIKCFDNAWSPDAWALAGANYVIKVATFYGTVIAFQTFFHDKDHNTVFMPKVGVLPAYRRKGIGRSFVKDAIEFAGQVKASRLETLIPESMLRPTEPSFCGHWTKSVGFKATGIEKDVFVAMGQLEDGIKFTLSL